MGPFSTCLVIKGSKLSFLVRLGPPSKRKPRADFSFHFVAISRNSFGPTFVRLPWQRHKMQKNLLSVKACEVLTSIGTNRKEMNSIIKEGGQRDATHHSTAGTAETGILEKHWLARLCFLPNCDLCKLKLNASVTRIASHRRLPALYLKAPICAQRG